MNRQQQSVLQQGVLGVLLLLLAAVLCDCSTDEGSVAQNGSLRPLVFAVSSDAPQGSATRGTLLNEMTGAFGLLGSQYTGDFGTGRPMNFMYNEVAVGSGTDWLTGRGYIVPASTYNLKFFAYYPYYEDIRTEGGTVYMSDTTLSTYPYFTYVMPQNAEDQEDLMWAVSEQVKADATGRLDTVRLHFHHLLTGVSISAGESSEEGYIRRVTITNLWRTGQFNYRTEKFTTYVDEEKTNVYSDLDLKVGTAGSGYRQADAAKSFLVLPQLNSTTGEAALLASSELQVQFESAGKVYTFTKGLSALKDALAVPGNNIVLRLAVESLQRMKIEAHVSNWEHGANFDGAVSDQPVLDLGYAISGWAHTSTVDDGQGGTMVVDNTTDVVTGPQ